MPRHLATESLALTEQLTVGSLARLWLTMSVGVLLGAATAALDLSFTLVAPLGLALSRIPGPHRGPLIAAVDSAALALTDLELRRVTHFHGKTYTDALIPRRCRRYLALRASIGMLGAGVLLLLLLCLVVATSMVSAWVLNGGWGLIENGTGHVDNALIATVTVPGILMIFVAVAGVGGVGSLDRWFVVQMLGRHSEQLLHRRVAELTSTRDHVVDAINDERRRIERDLHDGVQQRLVALGMLIGRARRSDRPEQLRDLLQQAHLVSQETITDLREVANRVYPIALDKDGLRTALELLAERSGLRVRLDYELTERLRPAVETVVYFAVSEAVANAVKHARPTIVEVTVTAQRFDRVLATVTDDGCGGANPGGSGLSGLARRVAAVDGSLAVRSPPGGPTTVTVSVPCG